MAVRKGLGKGLEAFFSATIDDDDYAPVPEGTAVIDVDVLKIEPSDSQPRRIFDEEKLHELAESIKSIGIIQPIILKQKGAYYSIIAGERRWRAARIAGLSTVPAIVKDYSDIETIEAALIENIQRTDLNPLEEAFCYQRLIEEYAFTQEQLSERVGKSRSHIANSLRLLSLSEPVRRFVQDGRLSMGHARTLVSVRDNATQLNFAEKIIEEGLSVRETERLVNDYINSIPKEEKQKHVREKSSYVVAAESDLRTVLGTKVNIAEKNNRGKIEIEFYSPAELDRLLVLIRNLKYSEL
ncbi:MAG: ParB/RepB/Spo0J family partition protein [Clostridiales bacterium]|nr:ParB/RepB/Spo0J family partition protein [Clostridiales bacterium]